MSPVDGIAIAGDPTAQEAAAITAALTMFVTAPAADADPRPWAYRSAWRHAAIDEGVQRVS